MQEFGLVFDADHLPGAGNPALARIGRERWHEASADDPVLAAFADALAADPAGERLLDAVFGNSPFLSQCATREPDDLRAVIVEGPDGVVGGVIEAVRAARGGGDDPAGLARRLRVAKRRLALAVAVADLAGAWPLEKVTGALSDFADAALSAAAAHVLRQAAAEGAFALADPADPEPGSGLVILGMGKLGARELNYSSDVDLIVLYDPERVRDGDPTRLHNHFVRLTRQLVRLLEERTADGYVFRTDLRLRPDPASTPIAMTVTAAEIYYESLGQNWERAAMIKARPVAGDLDAGAQFVAGLRPYVWRRHLDFAAIQDIHSIKRQIDAHRGGGRIAVAGHNVKLGRGGIREIEFFAQTQQLIWGGREPKLRAAATVDAIRALADAGKVSATAATDLVAAYRFLRRVEHRLQMIDDSQTHTIPEGEAERAALAVFLGYPDVEAMAAALLTTLRTVEGHYAELFEDAPKLSAPGAVSGNLVFTGAEADPDTIATIARLGFRNPQAIDTAIRGWHHGRTRATRSTRARELLTELVPGLLAAFARTPFPDDAFLSFDAFLSRVPAGVQLFSMFYSNPHLLDLVAEIIGKAPRLAEHLSRHPSIIDTLLGGDFFGSPPTAAALERELEALLDQAAGIEDVLDACRRWANDRRFQVGVQFLRGALPAADAGGAFSDIAEVAIRGLYPRVADDFARQHGRLPGAALSIIAMGKLGGREMTPTSDLDLVFIYDVPDGVDASDGPRPLSPAHYFARLTQRLINALTAPTAEGVLYEVDMRLRPSGHAGPIASSVAAWVRYHAEASWTWEHMALTRARPIAGSPSLNQRMAALIGEVLCRRRDAEKLLVDVADMRQRVAREHAADNPWDTKYRRGGLLDIEFIAQYLQLRHAHDRPRVLATNTAEALAALGAAGFLPAGATAALGRALALWQGLQTMLRLTLAARGGRIGEGDIPGALQADLARVGGAVDFATLKDKMREVADEAQRWYRTLIDLPAGDGAATPRNTGPEENAP